MIFTIWLSIEEAIIVNDNCACFLYIYIYTVYHLGVYVCFNIRHKHKHYNVYLYTCATCLHINIISNIYIIQVLRQKNSNIRVDPFEHKGSAVRLEIGECYGVIAIHVSFIACTPNVETLQHNHNLEWGEILSSEVYIQHLCNIFITHIYIHKYMHIWICKYVWIEHTSVS